MKILKILLPVSLILAFSFTSVFASSSNFKDVKKNSWYASYVNKIVAKDGIKGYPDNTFRPKNNIKTSEFIKIVVAMLYGEQDKVPGQKWYKPYVDKALEENLIDDSFLNNLDRDITREKMAVIMVRALEKNEEVELTDEFVKRIDDKLLDEKNICKLCKDYVYKAYTVGLVNGYKERDFEKYYPYPDKNRYALRTVYSFKPTGKATRAEASAMLVRLIDKTERVENCIDLSKFKESNYYMKPDSDKGQIYDNGEYKDISLYNIKDSGKLKDML